MRGDSSHLVALLNGEKLCVSIHFSELTDFFKFYMIPQILQKRISLLDGNLKARIWHPTERDIAAHPGVPSSISGATRFSE
jgi:hypothetical protein